MFHLRIYFTKTCWWIVSKLFYLRTIKTCSFSCSVSNELVATLWQNKHCDINTGLAQMSERTNTFWHCDLMLTLEERSAEQQLSVAESWVKVTTAGYFLQLVTALLQSAIKPMAILRLGSLYSRRTIQSCFSWAEQGSLESLLHNSHNLLDYIFLYALSKLLLSTEQLHA